MNYYIFASDPHGTGDPWISKIKTALNFYPTAQIVFGGDYIDGRKFSKETTDYVRKMENLGHIALMGNHEQLMLDAVDNKDDTWEINGNKSTIKSFCGRLWSYPLRISKFRLQAHEFIDWARKLPDIYETKNIIFVHAGLDLTKKDPVHMTSHYDKLWMREKYMFKNDTHVFAHNPINKTIVTGHTPTCLINGHYESTIKSMPNLPESCPVLKVKYNNEFPRFFTDGGCHSSLANNNGNVVVLRDTGNLEHIF